MQCDKNIISFKPLEISDFEYMYKWLNLEHVKEWYHKRSWTLKEIEEKYLPYINGDKPIQSYLIMYDNSPIGYIQTYKVNDYPDYAELVGINEDASGLDVFIGEKEYINKGLGKHITDKFLNDIVFSLSDSVSCILGPEPHNIRAIKTYEKAGFKHIKTIKIENELEYIMRVSREGEVSYDK